MMNSSKWAVGSGQRAVATRHRRCALSDSTARCPLPTAHSPRGVTLIELLVTMAIMAIIAAAILGTVSAAMESARRTRTQTLVTRISQLINDRLATYQTRRVDINPAWITAIETKFPDPRDRGRAMADLRLLAVRELLKYEMPDRWSDATEVPRILNPAAVPSLAQAYRRRYAQALEATEDDAGKVITMENAECLYLCVMLATGDGEARTQFSEQDIEDTDEDGVPEFVDGWGNPIQWIRWPAGFVVRSALMSGDAEADHDPLDPFRRNQADATPDWDQFPDPLKPFIRPLREVSPARPAGFRLVPLVYSSGPDGLSDIDTSAASTTASVNGPAPIALDPYAIEEDGTYQFGYPEDNANNPDDDDNFIDNIHNHLSEY